MSLRQMRVRDPAGGVAVELRRAIDRRNVSGKAVVQKLGPGGLEIARRRRLAESLLHKLRTLRRSAGQASICRRSSSDNPPKSGRIIG